MNHDIKDDTKSLQDVLPINELEEEVLPTTELKEEVLPTNEKEQLHLNAEMENSPKIMVVGVGGAGSNAVNNMISQNLAGVEFLVCNTDAQHLKTSLTENRIQMGSNVTGGYIFTLGRIVHILFIVDWVLGRILKWGKGRRSIRSMRC